MKSRTKIVFLNLTGVLTSKSSKIIEKQFDPICVKYLNTLTSVTSSSIVLSSSWRNSMSLANLRSLLKREGVIGKIIDTIPDLYKENHDLLFARDKEIERWLIANPKVNNFVILDDEDLGFSQNKKLNKHWIIINDTNGLTKSNILQAMKIFDTQTYSTSML